MSRISRDRVSFSSSTTPTYVEQAMHASVRKVSLSRKGFTTVSKKSQEEESPVKPDSTTEPTKVMHDFQDGDDVFFENAEGQSVLGTVSKVCASSCLVSFDDGTEQWAACKRLRKFGSPVKEEPPKKAPVVETAARSVQKALKKTEGVKVTCVKCKCSTEISPSKATGSRVPFRCSKCEGGLVSQDFVTLTQTKVLENYVKQTRTVTTAAPSRQPDGHANGEVRKSLPSSGSIPPVSGKRVGSEITILNYFKPNTSVQSTVKAEVEECFHCKGDTMPFQRIKCKMCSRFCHLFCLQLQSTPMHGDRFWDVMCASCGTQNGSSGSKGNRIFSVRRNVSSWADVAQLLINCMSVKSRDEGFALKSQILPFMKKHNDVLHLPRMYKQASDQQREINLLGALTSSTWRFMKKHDKHGSEPLWCLAPAFHKEVTSKKKANDDTRNSSCRGSGRIVQGSSKTPANTSSGGLNGNMQVPGGKSNGAVLSASQPNSANGNSLHKPTGGQSLGSQANLSSSSAASRLMQSSPKRGLSIIPIPKPGSGASESTGYSAEDVKISITSPKVSTKEVLLRKPVVTNIVLSPTTTSSVSDSKINQKTMPGLPRHSMGIPNSPVALTPGKLSAYRGLDGEPTSVWDLKRRTESASVSNTADPSLRKRSVPEDFIEASGNIKRPRLLDSVPSAGPSPQKLGVLVSKKPKLLRSSLKKNKYPGTASGKVNNLKIKTTKGKLGKKSSVSPSSLIDVVDVDEDPEQALMEAHENKLPANQSTRQTRRLARANHMKASTAVVPNVGIEDPEDKVHKQWQANLLGAIMYGGLRPRCLPETFSAACFFDDMGPPEEDNAVSDSESVNSAREHMKGLTIATEKKAGGGLKSLEDPSSYHVASSRVGPSGETEYLVIWHEPKPTTATSGFFAQMERILFPDGVPLAPLFAMDVVEEDEDEDEMDVVEVDVIPEKVTKSLNAANGSAISCDIAQKLTSNYKVGSSNTSVLLRSNSLALVPGGDGSSHIFDIGVD